MFVNLTGIFRCIFFIIITLKFEIKNFEIFTKDFLETVEQIRLQIFLSFSALNFRLLADSAFFRSTYIFFLCKNEHTSFTDKRQRIHIMSDILYKYIISKVQLERNFFYFYIFKLKIMLYFILKMILV